MEEQKQEQKQEQEQESKRKVIKEKFNRFRRKGEKPNYSYRNLTEKDLLFHINRELRKNNKYLKSIDYILHLFLAIFVFVIIMYVIFNDKIPRNFVEVFLNTLYYLMVV